jgi:hypothetical protein
LCSSRGVDVAEATAEGTELRDLRLGMPDNSVEHLVPKKKAGVMVVQVRSGHTFHPCMAVYTKKKEENTGTLMLKMLHARSLQTCVILL